MPVYLFTGCTMRWYVLEILPIEFKHKFNERQPPDF